MKTLNLTQEEVSSLSMFLRITTKYREGEYTACLKLSEETKTDGSPAFPNMASNAEWWAKTDKNIQGILKKLDASAVREEE